MTVRVAWDPELPVEASTTFTTGGRTFRGGEAFPWRELGILEHDVYAMWKSFLVHHPLEASAPAAAAESNAVSGEIAAPPAPPPAAKKRRGRPATSPPQG